MKLAERFRIRGYENFRSDVEVNVRTRQGAAAVLSNAYYDREVSHAPSLQAVAVNVFQPLKICYVYLPDSV